MTTNLAKHTTKNPVSRFFLFNFLKNLILFVKPLKISSVLDVGCGEGFILDLFQKSKIGKKLEGIDFSEEALKIGKKLHPKIVLKKGDIYKLHYKSNSFDLVLCTEVLEHLENPEKALQELIRISKKYVLLTVPNEPFFTMQRFFRGKNILHLGDHPEHIQHWSSSSFEKFVEKNKSTKIIKIKHPFPWTMILLEKNK